MEGVGRVAVVGLILVDSVSVIQKKNQMEIFWEKQIQKARCWQDGLAGEGTGLANLLI